ncbi:MAG: sialidase family protein [Terriglobia bacterium]
MIRKTCFLKAGATIVLLLFGVAIARSANETVYQVADGIVRPSPLKGAKQAYLPIIMPSNHASNLLALPNGSLLCFWFAGTWEGNSGVSIVMSRLDHGSDRWTLPVVLSHHPGWSDQNPVPFWAPDGRLWLFHTSQKAGMGETTAVVYELTSKDQGNHWTQPKLLFAAPGSFIRQHLVIFHHEWLFPAYYSASKGTVNEQYDHSIVKVSKDDGKTWIECGVPGSGGLIQMDIVQLLPPNLIAFFRSKYADWIYKSSSTDGCHWTTPVSTQLPNNDSSIQAARLKDGHLVIAFNNAQAATTRGLPRSAPRKILSVALSIDDGKTWPWVRDVRAGDEPPPFRPGERSEYSYPSIIQAPDGMIQMTYTFRRETIKYMSFPEQWIKQGTTEGVFKGDPKP